MINIGVDNTLTILRDTKVGLFLGTNTPDEEILLPNKYVPKEFKIGDQMTKTMYVLAILSTIFLPLNFIASLLGVNVSGIPGASNPNAFLIVCIIVIIIGIIEYLWFKKNRYF